MKFKAAIFDMDGTVLDTIEDLKGSLNYALKSLGYRADYTDEDLKIFFGSGVDVAFLRALSMEKGMGKEDLLKIGTPEEMLPEGVSRNQTKELRSLFAPHYVEHCTEHTGPYPGILEAVQRIRKAGIKTAVVSNKLDTAVKELVEECFPDCFDVAMGEKEGVRRKPYPDMVEAALRELNVNAEDAVYIGDSEVDMETAFNASLPAIGVTWGFRDDAYLVKHGAKILVQNAEELVKVLLE